MKKFSLHYKDWRIQTKLLVILVLLSWIPVVILLGINLQEQYSASEVKIENEILKVVSSTVQGIQTEASRYIRENHQTLEQTARDPVLVEALLSVGEIPMPGSGQTPGAGQTPPAQPGNGEQAGEPPAGNNSGSAQQPGQGTAIPADLFTNEHTEAAGQFLAAYGQSNPEQIEISLFNAQGVIIASEEEMRLGTVELRPDVAAALEGTNYTDSIHLNPANAIPGFFISTPVIYDNQVIGAVAARLLADSVIGLLSTSQIEDPAIQNSLDLFIVDQYGIIMAHSDPSFPWQYHILGTPSEEDLTAIGALLAPVQDAMVQIPALQPLEDALSASFESGAGGTYRFCMPNEVSAAYDANCGNGEYYMAGYSPLRDPITGDVLFNIVVTLPEAQFLGPIRQQAALSIAGAVVMSIVLFAVAFMIARTLAQPIRTLMGAAVTVEKEEPFDPATLEDISAQNDEIGKLAKIFSQMAKVVQEREIQLRKQIETLRVEINQKKRKEDVQKITEGDFFKDLKAKAQKAKEHMESLEDAEETPPDEE